MSFNYVGEFFSKSGGCLLQLFMKLVEWNAPSVHPLALASRATNAAAQNCRSDDFCPGFEKAGLVNRDPEVKIERLIWDKDEDWEDDWIEYYSGRRDGLLYRAAECYTWPFTVHCRYKLKENITLLLGDDVILLKVDTLHADGYFGLDEITTFWFTLTNVKTFADVCKLKSGLASIVWPFVPLDQPIVIRRIYYDRGMYNMEEGRMVIAADFPHWPVAIRDLSRGQKCFLLKTLLDAVNDSMVF